MYSLVFGDSLSYEKSEQAFRFLQKLMKLCMYMVYDNYLRTVSLSSIFKTKKNLNQLKVRLKKDAG